MTRSQKLRAELRLLDESDQTTRWVVSYADFITLLFAFFVVMYSISSVNDGKFRVLSNSMVTEFRTGIPDRPVPIDFGGRLADRTQPSDDEPEQDAQAKESAVLEADVKPFIVDENASVLERVQSAIGPQVDDVVIRDGKFWLEVQLPSELLFTSGRASLNENAAPIMSRMAQAIDAVDTPIRVEGFTDNVPIRGGRFASNWQLSAARAASVVQSFATSGIDPELLSAIGYGEFHPITSNDSAEGRGENRRVVVAIAKHKNAGVIGPVVNSERQADSIAPRVLRRVTQLPGSLGIL